MLQEDFIELTTHLKLLGHTLSVQSSVNRVLGIQPRMVEQVGFVSVNHENLGEAKGVLLPFGGVSECLRPNCTHQAEEPRVDQTDSFRFLGVWSPVCPWRRGPRTSVPARSAGRTVLALAILQSKGTWIRSEPFLYALWNSRLMRSHS